MLYLSILWDMKKLTKVLLFAGLLININACRQEGHLLRNINGIWKIESVRMTGGQVGDSAAAPQGVSLEFANCSRQQNQTECPAYYTQGGQRYEFGYKVDSESGGIREVNISARGGNTDPDYLRVARGLVGNYDIITLDDDRLVIKCPNTAVNQVGYNPYDTREITARR